MPKTLLAVDDSMTMRKVIEMTFAGEDVRVLSVPNGNEAVAACRSNRPDIVVADLSLGDGPSGYDLCRAIKDEFKGIPVIVLSSKQNPYDPARGQASGADANIDKPYDTAKMIELVKKTLEQGRSLAPSPIAAAGQAGRSPMFGGQPAAQPAPVIASAPPPAAAQPMRSSATVAGMPQPRPATASPAARPNVPAIPPANPALKSTLSMGSDMPGSAAAIQRAQAAVAIATSTGGDVQHGTLAELAQMGGANGSGDLSTKLGQLGLNASQIDAVMAISREVVERVVWEVVPVLAETLVKEEIARLTRE